VKRLFTLSVFALIALAFWGLKSYEEKSDAVVNDIADPHFVDLFMRDFKLTAMGDNGKPSYTLQASYFEHFNDNTNSLIENPVIHILQDNNLWVITAKTGEIDDDNHLIILNNDVVMQQQETDFPVQIKTSQLKINTDSKIAKSDRQVNIIQKEFKLQSKGMILHNTSGELELLASVKGTYVQAD
jgi:LPS export ABC transporter protein LptC